MKNILVATDLTDRSKNAFARAVQLAQLSGAKLHVLHVRAPLPDDSDPEKIDATAAAISNRVDAFILDRAGNLEIENEVHIEQGGRVHDLIVQTCRRVRADLAVVGRSSRSRDFPTAILRTSGRVVVNATFPVLIVSEPVSGNYAHVLLEAGEPDDTVSMAMLISDFGPDVRMTVLAVSGVAARSTIGLFRRLAAAWRRRRLSNLLSRIAAHRQARRLPHDRVRLETAEGAPLDVLQARLGSTRMDLVAVTDMVRRLQDPELGERTRQALASGSCDVIAY